MWKWIIVAVVVLVVVAAALAYALVNLNAYLKENKDWLAARVEAALGRTVSFEEVTVSLWGGFGARVTELRIADDPRFSEEDFVRADDAQVSIRILPALFGRYEVGRILLDRPTLTVIRTTDGFNFDSIGRRPGEAAPGAKVPPAARPEGTETTPAGPPAAFLVARTEIREARLRYVDRTTKPVTDVVVERLDLSASDVSPASPVRLAVAAALFGGRQQNLRLSGTIGPLGSPPDAGRAPLDLVVEAGPIVLDEVKKLAALKGAIPPELSAPDPVSVRAALKGTVEAPSLTASLDATRARLGWGETFTKPAGVAMTLEVAASRSEDTLEIRSLALQLADLALSAQGTVTTSRPTRVDLQIDSNRAPLSGWDRLLPALAGRVVSGQLEVHVRARGVVGAGRIPELTGSLALEDVSARGKGSPYEIEGLSTRIQLRGDAATVPPTRFWLGGSPVELEAKIDSLRARRGSFRLRSPGLRAASLGLAGETVRKEEVIRGLDLSGSFAAPPGRDPALDGTLRSESGSLRALDYRNLRADLSLRERVATLKALALEAFEGILHGDGRYDLGDPTRPQFDFRSKIRGMRLKGFLGAQFPGAEERIEGTLDADLRLAGPGGEWARIRDGLRGAGSVDVMDGVLKDVNIAEQVLTAVTGIPGLSRFVSPRTRQRYPDLFATGDTRFDKLGGTVEIVGGVARTSDLTLAARDYAIRGRGAFALENRLDFTAALIASQRLTQDVVEDVKEAKYLTNEQGRLVLPFRLTGSLPGARVGLDTDSIAKAVARGVVEKGIEKLLGGEKKGEEKKEGEDPRRDLLQKGLERLFRR